MNWIKLGVVFLTAFALGYFWPRTHWEFDPDTLKLCYVKAEGSRGCSVLQLKGTQWIPLPDK